MRSRPRSTLLLPLAAALALAAAAACGPPATALDIVPPRVLSVEPATPVLQTTDALAVVFSEAVNAESINEDTVVVAARAQVTPTFLSDLNSPPLSDTRKEQIVPVTITLDPDGTRVSIAPKAPLDARTAYTLLISDDVRDKIGNPLFNEVGQKSAFRFDFTTDDGPPIVATHDVVTADRPLVAPNRRRFIIVFDQPMRGITNESVQIVAQNGAATITPTVEAVLLDESRTVLTILLGEPASGCFRLSPDAGYAVSMGHGITDDEGQDLAATTIDFPTGPTCDASSNVVVGAPFPIGGETTATIRFDTTKASTTAVRFGTSAADLDCLGAPCPALGAPALVPAEGGASPKFVHSVEITGLTVNQTYFFKVLAEDDVGTVGVAQGSVGTAPLAKLAINEVMANAPAAITPESAGEYIELVNWGDVDESLAGFAIAVDGGDVGGGDTCALPDTGAPVIPAGGFLVLVPSTFQAEFYGGVDAAATYKMPTSTVCGSLTNSRAQSFVLLDGEGRPLSSISSYASLVPKDDGRSLERKQPSAPDVEASFCFSRSDVGPTPGEENGVLASGCEAD